MARFDDEPRMKAARAAVAGCLRSPPRRPQPRAAADIEQQDWNRANEAERWQMLKDRGTL